MNKEEAYSNKTLTEYLLGQLPDAETEQLDELSIRDDEFVARLDKVELELVDAYVEGELTGEMLDRFKSHYLGSPLRRGKVLFADSLQKVAWKDAVSGPEIRAGRAGRDTWASILSPFLATRSGSVWQWASVAAVLLMMITGGFLLFENVRMRRQLTQLKTPAVQDSQVRREDELRQELTHQRELNAQTEQELARVREEYTRLEQQSKSSEIPTPKVPHKQTGTSTIASFLLTPQLRSAAEIKTLTVPAGKTEVAMQLQLEPNDYSSYRVELFSESDNRVAWRSGIVRRPSAGSKNLVVGFPARLLKQQAYLLRVSGISRTGATETIGDFPFRVMK
jgi:hypothetical protein